MAKLKNDIVTAIVAGVAVKLIWDWAQSPAGQAFLGPLWPGNLGKDPSLYKPETLPKGTGMPDTGPLRQLPAVHTPMSGQKEWEDVWWKALEEVEPNALTVPGTGNAVKMFMAHSAREIGKAGPKQSMYHYNPGFLTTNSGPYFLWPADDTKHKYIVFNFPQQGVVYMLRKIKDKWPEAWEAAWTGDTTAYVKGLKVGEPGGYAETSFNGYWPMLDKLYKELGGEAGGNVIPFPAM